jgi:hypothetical protein
MSHCETAHIFFEACETGQGWAACEAYCHADAMFACEADALADTTTFAAYADWIMTKIWNDVLALRGLGWA